MKMTIAVTPEVSTSVLRIDKTCKAAISSNNPARCRNEALEGSDYCVLPEHQEGVATPSGTPDTVLAWFKLNDTWADRFEHFLVAYTRTTRRQRQINEKHTEQALAIGRNPKIREKIVDSGSPIFGKMGVQNHNVWAGNVLEDLFRTGYHLSKAEVCKKNLATGGVEARLLLEFRLDDQEDALSEPAMRFFVDAFGKYADAPFRQTLVWANPPKPDTKELVHTLNFRGRNIDQKPDVILHFDGSNDWFLTKTPPDEAEQPVIA
jgi:hypothetical protein